MNDLVEKAKQLAETHGNKRPKVINDFIEQAEETFGRVSVTMKDHPRRTDQQNKAMHKYFELLSTALNDAGLDARKTLKPEVEIPWTPEMIKNLMWRPIQEAMTGKKSTTELTTVEPSEVHAVLNRHLSSKFGLNVEWPSDE